MGLFNHQLVLVPFLLRNFLDKEDFLSMIRSLRDVALAACISFMVVLALSYSSLANLRKLKGLPTSVAPALTGPIPAPWDLGVVTYI